MKRLLRYFRRHFVIFGISFIVALLILSFGLNWYNRNQMKRINSLRMQAEEVKVRLEYIFSNTLSKMSLSLRGFAINGRKQDLTDYQKIAQESQVNVMKLERLFQDQSLDTSLVSFAKIRKEIENYIGHTEQMKEFALQGNAQAFIDLLNTDQDYDLWQLFTPFYQAHFRYEDKLVAEAQEEYDFSLDRNILIQFILLLTALPILGAVVYKLQSQAAYRRKMLGILDQNNRKYLFDSGNETDSSESAIETSVSLLQKTADFVNKLTAGTYENEWEGLSSENEKLNQTNLTGRLLNLQAQLKKLKEEETKRIWLNQGLTRFSEIIGWHQHNSKQLLEESVRFLTHYLQAQQGGLFSVKDENPNDVYLELEAVYAFDRNKLLDKRIDAGQGLVGQTYLEGETTLLNEVPYGYINITSGLGEANPSGLVIVPMKANAKVVLVLELASLQPFEPHQVAFLEKAGEFLALRFSKEHHKIEKALI